MRSADMPADVPLLILANKQDLPTAYSVEYIQSRMGVDDIRNSHATRTLPCCAVTGEGLHDALDLLHDMIVKSRHEAAKRRKKLM